MSALKDLMMKQVLLELPGFCGLYDDDHIMRAMIVELAGTAPQPPQQPQHRRYGSAHPTCWDHDMHAMDSQVRAPAAWLMYPFTCLDRRALACNSFIAQHRPFPRQLKFVINRSYLHPWCPLRILKPVGLTQRL